MKPLANDYNDVGLIEQSSRTVEKKKAANRRYMQHKYRNYENSFKNTTTTKQKPNRFYEDDDGEVIELLRIRSHKDVL